MPNVVRFSAGFVRATPRQLHVHSRKYFSSNDSYQPIFENFLSIAIFHFDAFHSASHCTADRVFTVRTNGFRSGGLCAFSVSSSFSSSLFVRRWTAPPLRTFANSASCASELDFHAQLSENSGNAAAGAPRRRDRGQRVREGRFFRQRHESVNEAHHSVWPRRWTIHASSIFLLFFPPLSRQYRFLKTCVSGRGLDA